MGSLNYGVRISANRVKKDWDFTKSYHVLSVPSGSKFQVPDLLDIEESGSTINGEHLKSRIEIFGGLNDVAIYDFGNGIFGLCLQDFRENHYFVKKGS